MWSGLNMLYPAECPHVFYVTFVQHDRYCVFVDEPKSLFAYLTNYSVLINLFCHSFITHLLDLPKSLKFFITLTFFNFIVISSLVSAILCMSSLFILNWFYILRTDRNPTFIFINSSSVIATFSCRITASVPAQFKRVAACSMQLRHR